MELKSDKIGFLINSKSGTSKTQKQSRELISYLKAHHPKTLFQTDTAQEMQEIAKDLVSKNYKALFACGGDGTINLVSKEIIGTDTALAMIPLGSGNGFARHHHIPLRWDKAIKVIEKPHITTSDTGLINGIHFVNVAGIGFAAKISHAFRGVQKRGLSGYARTVMNNLRMEPFEASVSNENSSWKGETWMTEFCNGSQWGNNFRLEPGARDDDGALNAVIFKKMSPVNIPQIGFRFLNNSIPESNHVVSLAGSNFRMEFEGSKPLHVDGEAIAMIHEFAEVSVINKNLKLWTF